MRCPKCHDALLRLDEPHDDVFRCAGCKGMWFEIMAHENLREDAETIDLVAPSEAENTTDPDFDPAAPAPVVLHCPACEHYPLIHMVDPQQPHLRFESCKFCYGRFYDAGEFRDFAEEDDSAMETFFADVSKFMRERIGF